MQPPLFLVLFSNIFNILFIAGGTIEGHGTYYDGIKWPISACGLPPDEYVLADGSEAPYCALNTNSHFANGEHCGRWVQARVHTSHVVKIFLFFELKS